MIKVLAELYYFFSIVVIIRRITFVLMEYIRIEKHINTEYN